LQGGKTLAEILSLAGGLRPDAGGSIKISRQPRWGPIPLSSATDDPDSANSVAEVKVKNLIESKNTADNIVIKPYDVITVPRAEMIYVVGQVNKSGGFVLNERETFTTVEALSLAGGLAPSAAPSAARIFRQKPGGSTKTEIPIDLKRILDGKMNDVQLNASDILFIPNSTAKAVGKRAIDALLQLGVGVAVWRR
jgi:polysaccharide export outer membrane protein